MEQTTITMYNIYIYRFNHTYVQDTGCTLAHTAPLVAEQRRHKEKLGTFLPHQHKQTKKVLVVNNAGATAPQAPPPAPKGEGWCGSSLA